jgi:hypothetical protein
MLDPNEDRAARRSIRPMDAARFDILTRALTTGWSRRSAVTAALGATLAQFGPRDAGAKKKKKSCPSCTKRKKGKCKGAVADGTVCIGGTCQGGQCVATSSGGGGGVVALPPPPCQGKPDFTVCGDGLECSGGVCAGGRPRCFTGPCQGIPLTCCGGNTCADTCFPVGEGVECDSTDDCAPGLTCVGFVCRSA